MLEDRVVFVNGEFIPWKHATAHIMSHSFSRGSALFEVLSIHNTSFGPAVFRLDEHVDRLLRTAKLVDFKLPLSQKELCKAVLDTVQRNAVSSGFIKILAYLPQVAFTIVPPDKPLEVSVCVVDPVQDLGGLNISFEKGYTACFSKWRKLDPQTVPIEAKVSANYLNGMMANVEAIKRGFDNAIMLDTQGFIAESGTDSVFFVKEGKLMTPSLGTVLKSISRKSILQIAETFGIDSIEGRLRPQLVYDADEIFLSSTLMKVMPVRKMEERELPGTPGPVTKRLADIMKEILSGRNDQFRDWLFPLAG
jgi:branched-chain amino acid aminotransferase